MPALEVGSQLLIEHTGSYLQQSMCAVWCPPHLLFLDEAFADHLVDRRFDELSGNRLAVPMTISVIRYRRHVARHVIHEFLEFFLQLRRAAIQFRYPRSNRRAYAVRDAGCRATGRPWRDIILEGSLLCSLPDLSSMI